MNDPPDPKWGGDPGVLGLNLPVGATITVVSNEDSKMDTDGSVSSRTDEIGRKRTSYIRICRQCTKRRKKQVAGQSVNSNFCQCETNNVLENSILMKKTTPEISKSPNEPQNTSQNVQNHSPQVTPQGVHSDKTQIPQSRQVGRSEYLHTDASPFLIHVQRIVDSPNDGTILHPIAFGNFLKKNNFQNIIPGSVKRIGRNRCAVAFSNFKDANNFLHNDLLNTHKFKAIIPTFNITRMGLVRGIPADWSDEDVLANISTPVGCGNILKIRRLNYKVQTNGTTSWKPSQSVVVTFDGQVLPKRIFMCYNALPVEVYTYPTIQCFNCCRYGHTKSICRSTMPRCYKCGADHSGESCSKEEDAASCIMCGGYHYATSKVCPEFIRQKEIKTRMAHSCISYAEASKLFPPVSRSYADVLTTAPNSTASNKPSLSTPTHSYKKTVFLKPRSPPKTHSGYDKAAHNALLKEFEAPESMNGCALIPKNNKSEVSIFDTIITLINTLLQSNLIKPSHVAPMNDVLCILKNNFNGFQDNPVELQEYNPKEK